MLIISFNKC